MSGFDIGAARAAQAEGKARTLRALAGMPEPEPVEPEPTPARAGGFDGGARTIARPAETHGQTLARIIASRSGSVADFEA